MDFMLAMNRDEQVSRPRALAPRRYWTGTRASLYPSEAGGGTWIGTNDAGLTLALVNWYAKPQRDRALCVSRGIIIPHLLAAENLGGCGRDVRRPAAVANQSVPADRCFGEGTQGARMALGRKGADRKRFGWARRHWFSSGYDEALTNKKARRRRAEAAKSSLTPAGLRKLHQSHLPERGPFSICMHRADAKTVSYTEIVATKSGAAMRYAAGSPCTKKPGTPRLLSFAGEA